MAAFVVTMGLSFIPAFCYAWILYWLDRYEKEPELLVAGVFFWGAIVATIGAIIASLILQGGVYLLTGSEALADVTGTVVIAPLVEESLKGIAVLLVYLLFANEFDSVLDGVVYAGIVGLGFAATENVLYLFFAGYLEDGWNGLAALFVLRVILGAWGHAVYTSFIGIGLAIARFSRNPLTRLGAPFLGWCVGVLVHALHNGMAVFLGDILGLGGLVALLLIDWTSWLVMFGVIFWAILRQKRWLREYLREEVEQGILTPEQYRIACSSRAQTSARFRSLWAGKRRATIRFYQLCAELAQKKHQLATMGEERGNTALIERLRGELRQLAPGVGVGG